MQVFKCGINTRGGRATHKKTTTRKILAYLYHATKSITIIMASADVFFTLSAFPKHDWY